MVANPNQLRPRRFCLAIRAFCGTRRLALAQSRPRCNEYGLLPAFRNELLPASRDLAANSAAALRGQLGEESARAMKVALGIAVAAAFATAVFAWLGYRGSGAVFIEFNACFALLAALVLPRPRAYVYTFLVAFLFLGFWFKVIFHAIAAVPFVEP